ncbi:tetratricopeptide repeat protein [Streptomyces sp. NPDC020681]|uniref:tetratricopeptide repeat protein n=1 Tax=Streptomyces sp. NPDC020681 TaxID=3365083 RepID=UPI0037A08019
MGWGVNLRMQRRHAEALERTDRALEVEPDNALGWVNPARVLHLLGRHDEAVADLDHALELAPGDAYAVEIHDWMASAL